MLLLLLSYRPCNNALGCFQACNLLGFRVNNSTISFVASWKMLPNDAPPERQRQKLGHSLPYKYITAQIPIWHNQWPSMVGLYGDECFRMISCPRDASWASHGVAKEASKFFANDAKRALLTLRIHDAPDPNLTYQWPCIVGLHVCKWFQTISCPGGTSRASHGVAEEASKCCLRLAHEATLLSFRYVTPRTPVSQTNDPAR